MIKSRLVRVCELGIERNWKMEGICLRGKDFVCS
jgi:hypothetical protein